MAESMRGTRLGRISYHTPPTLDAPSVPTTYVCPAGHELTLNFSVEAEDIPQVWDCSCGDFAVLKGKRNIDLPTPHKTPRTHFEILLERRSREELTILLKEAVAELRAQNLKHSA